MCIVYTSRIYCSIYDVTFQLRTPVSGLRIQPGASLVPRPSRHEGAGDASQMQASGAS